MFAYEREVEMFGMFRNVTKKKGGSKMSDITGTKAGPCREKYWSEIDTDEKIKRLRERVKYLEKRIESMSKKIAKLEDHHLGQFRNVKNGQGWRDS